MVYTEPTKTEAVSRATSHVTTQTSLSAHHFGGYSKRAIKKQHSFGIVCNESAVSLLESREQRYIKAIIIMNIHS